MCARRGPTLRHMTRHSTPHGVRFGRHLLRACAALLLLVTSLSFVATPGQAQASCGGLTVTVDIGAGDLPTDGDDVILGTQDGDDIIFGGDGDDRLRGGDGEDELRGEAGVDNLSGGRDSDVVDGGAGDDDAVRGGTGDDMITGGSGNDRLIAGNGGLDMVDGGDGDDALVTGGPRPDTVIGGAGNDVLKGHKGADVLEGGAGDDQLLGGPQPDLLTGGDGIDECNGGTEDDTAVSCETLINIETPPPVVEPPAPAASIQFLDTFSELVPAGTPYDSLSLLTDDTGSIGIEVPVEFTYADTAPNAGMPAILTGMVEGGGLEAPTVIMRAFDEAAGFSLNDVLAENGPALVSDCTVLTSEFELPAPPGFEELLFADSILVGGNAGAYVVYEGCLFGAEPVVLIEVALRSPTGTIVVMTFTVVTSAELDLIDQALPALLFD